MPSKLLKNYALLILSVFCFVAAGQTYSFCAAETANAPAKIMLFTQEDNGEEFSIVKDKDFMVELPCNPTTGFNWYFDGFDKKAFKLVDSGFNPLTDKMVVGAGGVSWWKIRPLKVGKYKICLLYYRIWEGKQKAVDKYEIKLLVQKDKKGKN